MKLPWNMLNVAVWDAHTMSLQLVDPADLQGVELIIGNLYKSRCLGHIFHFEDFVVLSWRTSFQTDSLDGSPCLLLSGFFRCEHLQQQWMTCLQSWQVEMQSWEVMVVCWIPCFTRGLWAAVQVLVLGCKATFHWSQTTFVSMMAKSISNRWVQQLSTRSTWDDYDFFPQ